MFLLNARVETYGRELTLIKFTKYPSSTKDRYSVKSNVRRPRQASLINLNSRCDPPSVLLWDLSSF